MHTHAIVIPEPNRVELREVELTAPGPDDLVVQTVYTSISAGTERMLLAGRLPHPMLSFPIVPGYETVGRVVGRGANVPAELEGQLVYVGGARCFVGVNPAWGGQAATLIADHRRVVPLGAIDPRHGVLLALAATALHGVDLLATEITENTEISAITNAATSSETSVPSVANKLLVGKRALVLGQGPVGQIAARLLRRQGAWVAVTDREVSRLERAVADLKIGPDDPPLAERAQPAGPPGAPPPPAGEHTLAPFDAIVEATGSMAALAEALPLLANGGTILLLGYYEELRVPYMPLFLKQARLLTAREWAPGDLARCRDLLADGSLDLRALITHQLTVEQVSEAYHTALHDPACLKLVLDWSV
jgi:3-hydroxyethyl bacteriochlorophyllide a dehydrogenase